MVSTYPGSVAVEEEGENRRRPPSPTARRTDLALFQGQRQMVLTLQISFLCHSALTDRLPRQTVRYQLLFSTPGQWERKAKRSAINDFIVDNAVDVLCLTETWLLPSSDEAKCSDLSPPGYRTLSFPRPSRGGGIAFVVADSLAPFLSVTAAFSFPQSFIRTVSADFLLTSTLTAHLLSLPSSSEPEKPTEGLALYGTFSGSP